MARLYVWDFDNAILKIGGEKMSERAKEYLGSILGSIGFAICVYGSKFGKAFGNLTTEDMQKIMVLFAFMCLFITAISLIGNFRLNVWLRPKEFIEAQTLENSPKSQTYAKERPVFRVLFTLWIIIALGYIFYVVKY